MDLTRLKKNWETLAQQDPMWAILSAPSKKNRKWDPEAFFQSGEAEIGHILNDVTAAGFPLRRETALDFGCGLGRLTQALCGHFQKCYGVDISPTMIAEAERCNRFGLACTYVLNQSPDLSRFHNDTADFIYSNIVLQHVPVDASKAYIAEFVRVVKPGGLLIFQIPSTLRSIPQNEADMGTPKHERTISCRTVSLSKVANVYSHLRTALGGNHENLAVRGQSEDNPTEVTDGPEGLERLIDMNGIPLEEVTQILTAAAATLVRVQEDESAGPEWFSFRYWVTKS
jgi:ubiquinone/menaquinone biosynthesis C-methylase UbiE